MVELVGGESVIDGANPSSFWKPPLSPHVFAAPLHRGSSIFSSQNFWQPRLSDWLSGPYRQTVNKTISQSNSLTGPDCQTVRLALWPLPPCGPRGSEVEEDPTVATSDRSGAGRRKETRTGLGNVIWMGCHLIGFWGIQSHCSLQYMQLRNRKRDPNLIEKMPSKFWWG